MKFFRMTVALSFCAVSILAAAPKAWEMHQPHQPIQITWLGQSAFEIVSSGGTNLLIDPFLTGNPGTPDSFKNLSRYKPSAILVTHSHFDHLGDAVEIAKASGAPVMGTYDFVSTLGISNLLYCEVGGRISVGDVIIHVVPAIHGSVPDGSPVGYVITFKDSRSVYHTGDTWITSDMGFIQSLYHPNIVLLCAGGGPYTQDPAVAALETKMLLFPSVIIPMHYGNGLATEQEVRDAFQGDRRLIVMTPGETRIF